MKEQYEKRKQAVALSYNEDKDQAPKMVAKGKGDTAENIIQLANKHNIPIQEDPSMVEILGKLDINESIPEELYQAVAEIFAFVYRLDQRTKMKS
ncbi:FlhB-like flagellar biosynthesis protein [Bacillus tianshenii]|nr:FlhB-like flagellar biosynthesis protein [Bacillus tianshenii]